MDALRSLGVARLLSQAQQGADVGACRSQAQRICTISAACHSAGELAGMLLECASWLGEPGGVDVLQLPLATIAACFSTARQSAQSRVTPQQVQLRPVLSYRALERARTTIDDFTTFYLPLHGLTLSTFFRHLPLLVFTEASIYQLDEENEDYVAARCTSITPPSLSTGSGSTLLGILGDHGLLSEVVLTELAAGEEYWGLERRLCDRMNGGKPVSERDVMQASSLKSFDYRLLHRLLIHLVRSENMHFKTMCSPEAVVDEVGNVESHSEYDTELFEFLRVDEQLVDIMDDLFDYENDVAKGSFNVLRGLVHASQSTDPPTLERNVRDADADAKTAGKSPRDDASGVTSCDRAAQKLAAIIGDLEQRHEFLLRRLPARVMHAYNDKRRSALKATSAFKYQFPPIVAPRDEAAFRREWHCNDGDYLETEEDVCAAKAKARRRAHNPCDGEDEAVQLFKRSRAIRELDKQTTVG